MPRHTPSQDRPWFDLVNDRLRGIRFGVVQLTVHDGRIVQIDVTERTRLPVGAVKEVAEKEPLD